MAADYTNWPTAADVAARLSAAGVTLRDAGNQESKDRLAALRLAVVQEVTNGTKRQFVADTVSTARVFDGGGTAEQEVDEIVSLDSVTVIGYAANPGYDLADVSLIHEAGKPVTRLVTARGSVPAWQTQAVLYPQYACFPAGRQNIQVTGKWGYGPVIPADLWEAVCGEVAVRATREALFNPNGRVTDYTFGDERKKYALDGAEATGWHDAFTRAIGSGPCGYKRPTGRRLRNLRPAMID